MEVMMLLWNTVASREGSQNVFGGLSALFRWNTTVWKIMRCARSSTLHQASRIVFQEALDSIKHN